MRTLTCYAALILVAVSLGGSSGLTIMPAPAASLQSAGPEISIDQVRKQGEAVIVSGWTSQSRTGSIINVYSQGQNRTWTWRAETQIQPDRHWETSIRLEGDMKLKASLEERNGKIIETLGSSLQEGPAPYSFTAFKPEGGPGSWSTCQIDYYMNLENAPKDTLNVMKAAFSELGKASGRTFTYKGETSIIPFDPEHDIPNDAQGIFIAFSDAEHQKALTGGVAGLTLAGSVKNGNINPNYHNAGMLLDTGDINQEGDTGGKTFKALVLHELGHAIGLGHTNDPMQLMHPYMRAAGPSEYQAGDIVGLRLLSPCGGTGTPRAGQ